jgi:hypothetical protein
VEGRSRHCIGQRGADDQTRGNRGGGGV